MTNPLPRPPVMLVIIRTSGRLEPDLARKLQGMFHGTDVPIAAWNKGVMIAGVWQEGASRLVRAAKLVLPPTAAVTALELGRDFDQLGDPHQNARLVRLRRLIGPAG